MTQPPAAPLQISALKGLSNSKAVAVILAVSAIIFAFLFWLVYVKPAAGVTSRIVAALPAVNAGFNSLSTIFLLLGFNAILRRRIETHLRFMLAALASSALFFVCYVVYHNAHGDTHFAGQGAVRPVYFSILISHIALSAVAVPLILTSFYLSLTGQYSLHRRVSRLTFPIWLYVSITGVVVFAMLKTFNG